MLPFAWLGTRTTFTNDTLLEMPSDTSSATSLRLVATKFGEGAVAPLTVVVESTDDLRKSSGLAWLDEVSRMLTQQTYLSEVRSATQPLGSTKPLDPARLSNRLAAVNEGFTKIEAGPTSSATAWRRARQAQGRPLVAGIDRPAVRRPGRGRPRRRTPPKATGAALTNDLVQAGSLVSNPLGFLAGRVAGGARRPPTPAEPRAPPLPKIQPDPMVEQLGQAVSGAGQIADGVKRASSRVDARSSTTRSGGGLSTTSSSPRRRSATTPTSRRASTPTSRPTARRRGST